MGTKPIVIGMLMCSVASATAMGRVIPGDVPWDFIDPLLWDSAVVHGTVIDVWDEVVTKKEAPSSSVLEEWTYKFARLSVHEVFRGTDIGSEFVVADGGGLGLLRLGEEVVVCANFFPTFRGGGYLVHDGSLIARRDEKWVVIGPGLTDPYMHPDHNGPSVRPPYDSLGEIRSRATTWNLEHVIREAEIIVEGKVTRIDMAYVTGDGGERARYYKNYMAVQQVYKGSSVPDTLAIATYVRGKRVSSWGTVVRGIKVGDTWLMFLKQSEVGYYPFAGFHGAFLVRGKTLIFGNRGPFRYDKNGVARAISRIMQE